MERGLRAVATVLRGLLRWLFVAGSCVVGVAQLVRAPDCGSGGRGFETRHSPQRVPCHDYFGWNET